MSVSLCRSPVTFHLPGRFAVFSSDLGWMAISWHGPAVTELSFGHATPADAQHALNGCHNDDDLVPAGKLVRRLQAYASGARDDFRDVQVDVGPLSGFQERVLRLCREIDFGQTLTYGQLARQAGSPHAARAVGNCMAANRVPIIVPCHRVVAAGGKLGGYSAAEGTRAKLRLLEMESPRAFTAAWRREVTAR